MNKISSKLLSIILLLLIYILFFVVLSPDDQNMLGWVLDVSYVLLPVSTVVYFMFLVGNIYLSVFFKTLLFIANIIFYQLFTLLLTTNLYIDDSFVWLLILIPSILGVALGFCLFNYRIDKIEN